MELNVLKKIIRYIPTFLIAGLPLSGCVQKQKKKYRWNNEKNLDGEQE